jgi:transposase
VDADVEKAALKAELAAAVASRDARIAELEAQSSEFERQLVKVKDELARLREALGRNSTNSNLPPSSDPPGKSGNQRKAERKRRKGKGSKRGGQPGHGGSHRVLLPPEQVDEFVELYPGRCESCWESLPELFDVRAKRHQFTELCPLAAHTTEYRRHCVVCACCGHETRAAYDNNVIPRFAFGPRLMSAVVLLTGVYHLSRRSAVRLLFDLLGVRISLGAVSAIEKRLSEAVEPAVAEAWTRAMSADVKHTDGTSWLRAGVMLSLWTVATSMVTVFKIVGDGRTETLRALFTVKRGVLVSDRATALKFWAMKRRQVCWAHLLRKFISFSERDGPAGTIGRELVEYTAIVFQYWHDFQDGKLSRAELRRRMAPVRLQFEAALRRAENAKIRRLSGSCADVLAHAEALWTFIDRPGVEPTNNHAERELRAFVLWRKRSFGTQSERGNLFAERLMSVAHTARKQGVAILAFLAACCEAHLGDRDAPSLFDRDFRAVA